MKIVIIGSKGFIGKESYLHFKSQKQNEVWGCDVVVDYTSKNYIRRFGTKHKHCCPTVSLHK